MLQLMYQRILLVHFIILKKEKEELIIMLKLAKLIIILAGITFISYVVLVLGLGWLAAHPEVIGKFFGEIINGFKSVIN
jgi:CHASE2 domain-containing sensor protein